MKPPHPQRSTPPGGRKRWCVRSARACARQLRAAASRAASTREAASRCGRTDRGSCGKPRTSKDYPILPAALLMKKRIELGVSPFPTGPANELPTHTHEAYEDAIRAAGRLVGGLLLEPRSTRRRGASTACSVNPEPMREALEAFAPGPDDDVYQVIEIAWQNGVLPKKGFDLVLARHGICSALSTMVTGSDLSPNPDLRELLHHPPRQGTLARALTERPPHRPRPRYAGAEASRRTRAFRSWSRSTPRRCSRTTHTTLIHRHLARVWFS